MTPMIMYDASAITKEDARNIGKPGMAIPVNVTDFSFLGYSMSVGVVYQGKSQYMDGTTQWEIDTGYRHASPLPSPITNCKNCGAALKGDCEYCGTRYL